MKIWHLFPTISAPMDFQMALDEVIFRRFEKNGRKDDAETPRLVLRFYYSAGLWVTAGYSLKSLRDASILESLWQTGEIPRGQQVPVCRRLTGGGYVLHGQDLIFSIVARKEEDDSFRSVNHSYLKIHKAVQEGFHRYHKNLRFYTDQHSLPRGQACFDYPIDTDLAYENQKIAGGAQKRSSGWMLHQESIQLRKGWPSDHLILKICEGFEAIFGVRIRKMIADPEILRETAHSVEKVKEKVNEGS